MLLHCRMQYANLNEWLQYAPESFIQQKNIFPVDFNAEMLSGLFISSTVLFLKLFIFSLDPFFKQNSIQFNIRNLQHRGPRNFSNSNFLRDDPIANIVFNFQITFFFASMLNCFRFCGERWTFKTKVFP